MKKIFAIYTTIELIDKPDWFDEYRDRFDVPYDPHITLTQPRFIKEKDVPNLKKIVSNFFSSKQIDSNKLSFTKIHHDRQDEEAGGCIMIDAVNFQELKGMQIALNKSLEEFDEYYDNKTRVYENEFIPHITIATQLNRPTFEKALNALPENFFVEASFPKAILAIVQDMSEKERKNPANLTYFEL